MTFIIFERQITLESRLLLTLRRLVLSIIVGQGSMAYACNSKISLQWVKWIRLSKTFIN